MTLKDRFKQLRVTRGLTQVDLADILKVSKSTISMYENGNRKPPLDVLEEITDFFNVDINYILGITDKSEIYEPVDWTNKDEIMKHEITTKVSKFTGKFNFEIDEYTTSNRIGPRLDHYAKKYAFGLMHKNGISLTHKDAVKHFDEYYNNCLMLLKNKAFIIKEK